MRHDGMDYDLPPYGRTQRDFYGKARVAKRHTPQGTHYTLFSYGTPICSYGGKKFVDHGCDKISHTTSKHVLSFLSMLGHDIKCSVEKWLDSLEYMAEPPYKQYKDEDEQCDVRIAQEGEEGNEGKGGVGC